MDGTLLDSRSHVLPSTVEALKVEHGCFIPNICAAVRLMMAQKLLGWLTLNACRCPKSRR